MFCATQGQQQQLNKKCRWCRYVVMMVGLACLLYTVGWFVLAQIVQNRVLMQMNLDEVGAGQFQCQALGKVGYPLRVGVACSKLRWEQPEQGLVVTADHIVADAPIYAPYHHHVQLQSPLRVQLSPAMLDNEGLGELLEGDTLEANFDSLIINTVFDGQKLASLTVRAENFLLAHPMRGQMPLMVAEFMHLSVLRQAGMRGEEKTEGGGAHAPLTVKLLVEALNMPWQLEAKGANLPPLSGVLHMVMDGAAHQRHASSQSTPSDDGMAAHLRGQSGRVERATLRFLSGGSLEGEGVFQVTDSGLLSGNFSVALGGMAAFQRSLHAVVPSQIGNLEAIFFVLGSMPKNAGGAPVIPIKIDEGVVRLGFLPIGTIPPL